MLFLEVATRKEAEALAPGAFIIAPVRGGYMAYRTREEAIIEAARMDGEIKRLQKVSREYSERSLEINRSVSQMWREHWALVFSCPNGFYDNEGDIVGEVKTKKTSKKAFPKKARKPASEKKTLRVIPGGAEASKEAR